MSQVREPCRDSDYVEYFCGHESQTERENLYRLTAPAVRSFSNCSDRLESHYGYTVNQANGIRREIRGYSRIKYLVMLSSCDYVDLKAYSADMRYILNTYIHAEESKIISELADMSLVELLAGGKNLTPDEVFRELKCDDSAKPEIIENNIAYEIKQRMNTNAIYYVRLSEMLKDLIRRRKNEAVDYAEYLVKIAELARKVLHPEDDTVLPESVKGRPARCAIYYYLDVDESLTLRVDEVIKASKERDFKEDEQKTRRICRSIYSVLLEEVRERKRAESETRELFEIVKAQPEYGG